MHTPIRKPAPPPFHAGARATWTDPSTGLEHANLLVEFVYPLQGSCCVRGWFGRMSRDGSRAETTRLVRIADCSAETPAEAV